MIFLSYLERFAPEIRAAVREFFKAAVRNQTHEGDMFLISVHGFFDERIDEGKGRPGFLKLSPYVFGPGYEAYEEDHASAQFYYRLRNHIISGDPEKYYAYCKTDPSWEDDWRLRVQLEMYMYQKFWEADMTLKKLAQLARLCNCEHYRWDLNLKREYRRGEFMRKRIVGKIQYLCPKFFRVISEVYNRQLRNAIAHSQYFFMGDHIILSNHRYDSSYHTPYITADEWDKLICKFVIFCDELNYYIRRVEAFYRRKVLDKHYGQQVRIVREDKKMGASFEWIKAFDSERWIWYRTWEHHYQPRFLIK